MQKTQQAKNVPEPTILACIAARAPQWATLVDVEDVMPAIPRKVLLAKLRSLIKRKVITGCACGCRGEFEVFAGPASRANQQQNRGTNE